MNNVLLISARITSSVMDGKNLDKLFIENDGEIFDLSDYTTNIGYNAFEKS